MPAGLDDGKLKCIFCMNSFDVLSGHATHVDAIEEHRNQPAHKSHCCNQQHFSEQKPDHFL